jgi:hypothetical protein
MLETEEVVAEPGPCGRWCVAAGAPSPHRATDERQRWRRHPMSRLGLGVCVGDSSPAVVEEFGGWWGTSGGFMMRWGSEAGDGRCRRGGRESSTDEDKFDGEGVTRGRALTGKKRFTRG